MCQSSNKREGQVIYRFYLLDQENHINAAESFSAPDDMVAAETAGLVYRACNDQFESYELFQGAKRVAGSRVHADGAGMLKLADVVMARQENILDLEERLQSGFACVRRSKKLLETTAALRNRVHQV
jgi:hypothetical protein